MKIVFILKNFLQSRKTQLKGEKFESHETQNQKITISKDVLRYIFKKYWLSLGRNKDKKAEDLADFYSHITEVISLTNENNEGLKKLIDISVSSINK